jgi:hypothetical protein
MPYNPTETAKKKAGRALDATRKIEEEAISAAKSTFRIESVEGEDLMDEVKKAGSKASDPRAAARKARQHLK